MSGSLISNFNLELGALTRPLHFHNAGVAAQTGVRPRSPASGMVARSAKLRKAVMPLSIETRPAHEGDCAHTPVDSAKGHNCWARN